MKYDSHHVIFILISPYVYRYHSFSSLSSFFSSTCSSSCSWCPSEFVHSFFADVNKCTESTHNCRIHFKCVNIPGSFGCAYNYSRESCQGKKSMYYVFMVFLTFKKNRIVASAIDPLCLAILKENEAFLNSRSDAVKKGNLKSVIEFSFLLIFINFEKREAGGGAGGIVRSLSSERLLMRSSAVNCLHTFDQDCRLS